MNSRSLLGVVLVALGVVLLLDRVGTLDAGAVIGAWWPTVFVLAGVLALLDRPPRPVAATVSMIIGVSLLAVTTGVLSGAVLAAVWPAALIALGLWFMTGRRLHRSVVDNGDAVKVTVLFSGQELANTSAQFRGGSVTALFGGVDLDLVRAVPAPDAELTVTTMFGGVGLTVPDDWRVVIDGPAIFGGFDNGATVSDPGAPTLKVRAFAMFGGIEIKTSPRHTSGSTPRQAA